MNSSSPRPLLSRIVLDTNIALDWLVFSDPSTGDLLRWIEERRAELIVNDLVIDELRRVLAYPQFNIERSRQSEMTALYESKALNATMPPGFSRERLLLPAGFPQCRDRDDDHFLALAFHTKAAALVTKDKALLKLQKKVRRFDLRIVGLDGLTALPELTS